MPTDNITANMFFEERSMEDEELVRLTVVESEVDANYIKNALEDQNIQAMMTGNEASAFGMSLDGADEVEIFVKADDLAKAKVLVEELMSETGEPIPAWTCKCGEDVDEGFGICWSCGAEYPAETPS
jgi:hypothetical protein